MRKSYGIVVAWQTSGYLVRYCRRCCSWRWWCVVGSWWNWELEIMPGWGGHCDPAPYANLHTACDRRPCRRRRVLVPLWHPLPVHPILAVEYSITAWCRPGARRPTVWANKYVSCTNNVQQQQSLQPACPLSVRLCYLSRRRWREMTGVCNNCSSRDSLIASPLTRVVCQTHMFARSCLPNCTPSP